MRSRLLAGAVAAGVSAALLSWGRERARIGGLHWHRVNHAGRTVTLWEGAAFATGAAAGAVVGGSAPAVVAGAGSAAFGALDDHAGDSASKGLKGHLGALARGEVTTGSVKIIGIGATGLTAVALADRRARREAHSAGSTSTTGGAVLSTLIGGAAVAGAANLGNLFDLRPGRALKLTLLLGAPLLSRRGSNQTNPTNGSTAAAAAMGAAAGVIVPDLRGEAMLGDTGANAAGALIGLAAVERYGWKGRLALLTGLTALTVASEKVSFTQVIARTPVLRELDEWGRPR